MTSPFQNTANHPNQPTHNLADAPHMHHSGWQATLGALTAAVLFLMLDSRITAAPSWLSTALVVLLLIPLVAAQQIVRRRGQVIFPYRTFRLLSFALLAVMALSEGGSLVLLVSQIHTIAKAGVLFSSAALIWTINTLVFALGYWELDGGGPWRRAHHGYAPHDFLFPQQTDEKLRVQWTPQFIDYLFLSFNTGTAFSPTDTMVLSRPAKIMMMAQATVALLTIGLLVARAVNIA